MSNESNLSPHQQSSDNPSPAKVAYMENEILRSLPNHLKQFIIDQNYSQYTPVNHASWRYIMRKSYDFLKDKAHSAYVGGLEQTGISVDKIPSIEEMNAILSKIGWAAVPVDGFIPPAAFMEFQAYRVLVIAADMRQINHIEYTPAPDIVHEAAGHAPIIADPQYAEYLRLFGEIGSKAMSSKKDFELYSTIRHLSILKESPDADPIEIEEAEKAVEYCQENLGEPSEMARLSRLHWFTVEYGLIGELDAPRLYGAGLLSSIGESVTCLKDDVEKLPYSLDTANYAFDITTKQPRLFVTPTFEHLIDVLNEFASTMAFKVGGRESIEKAIETDNVATCRYSSGLQISGVFSELIADQNGQPAYLKAKGPVNLAVGNKELDGHGIDYHFEGFSSPIGLLKDIDTPIEEMNDNQLKKLDITEGNSCTLTFESSVIVSGKIASVTKDNGKIILITFEDCTVTYQDLTLFAPDWGMFDMAVGKSIDSVSSGAADKDAYEQITLVPRERTVKVNYDDQTKKLHTLYQQVRDFRDNKGDINTLISIWEEVNANYPNDWLLPLDILQISSNDETNAKLSDEIRNYLTEKSKSNSSLTNLINDGLILLDKQLAAL